MVMSRTASFDVFDTLLTRRVGSPESSFLLLGKRLRAKSLIACTAEAFARNRQDAEHRAFANAGGLDSSVRLETIYQELGFILRLTPEQQRTLIQQEEAFEAELLCPVPEALEIVDAARQRGEQIRFVSDMYIGQDFVQQQLTKYGIYQPGDRCYVSCDYGKTKNSRRLYDEVLAQEKITADALTHCGNNGWADVKMARKAGANALPFFQGNLNRYEEVLEKHSWQTEGLSSAIAGASRLVRLSQPAVSEHDKALRDVSASVAAPFLIGFTLWVLKRAKALGLKRLYFLARDGQILLAIAQRLIKKLDFDCELHYLYGSRQSWSLPSLTTVNEDSIANMFPVTIDVDFLSVRVLLARFDLQPESVESLLFSIGLTQTDWDRHLSASEHQALRQLVLGNGAMQQAILQRAAEKRDVMKQYLGQMGLMTSEPIGLIDLGTGATLHRALASVLATEGLPVPHAFYLGLRRGVKNSRFGFPEVYLQDMRRNLGFKDIQGLVTMMETFCSADHGSVVTYQRCSDGTVEPVLTMAVNQPVLDWGFERVRETVSAVADALLLDTELVNPEANFAGACMSLFRLFWFQPSRSEAMAWGSFPMEDGWGSESVSLKLATAYRWQDLLKRQHRRHWWAGAALAQSSTALRWVMQSRSQVKLQLKRVKQRTQRQLGQQPIGEMLNPAVPSTSTLADSSPA